MVQVNNVVDFLKFNEALVTDVSIDHTVLNIEPLGGMSPINL